MVFDSVKKYEFSLSVSVITVNIAADFENTSLNKHARFRNSACVGNQT